MATKITAILHALSLSLLLTLAHVYEASGSCIADLGPDNCLISRIDTVPCNPLNIVRTEFPGINEFADYRTRFRCIDEFLQCQILSADQVVAPIPTTGSANLVLIASSPRYFIGSYKNDRFVEYNIQCGAGRLATVQLLDMDLEPKTCSNMCRDFVQSMLPDQTQSPDVCGTNTSVDLNPNLLGSLTIVFRSSPEDRFPGFQASITCADPQVLDDSTCSDPTTDSTRKKRSLDAFTERVRRHYAELLAQREKRNAAAAAAGPRSNFKRDEVRFTRSEVPPGEEVTFRRKTVMVSGHEVKKIKDVNTLVVFSAADTRGKVFRNGTTEGGLILPFPGPGSLNVVGRSAYFRQYDPSDFALSEEEKRAFTSLMVPQIDRARDMAIELEESDESRSTSTTDGSRTDNDDEEGGADDEDRVAETTRRRRNTEEGRASSDSSSESSETSVDRESSISREYSPAAFGDEAVLLALRFENACSPVLRAAARSILEDTEERDPERMIALRAEG